jgi:hypothetical protein
MVPETFEDLGAPLMQSLGLFRTYKKLSALNNQGPTGLGRKQAVDDLSRLEEKALANRIDGG